MILIGHPKCQLCLTWCWIYSKQCKTNLQNLKVVASSLTFLINPFFAPQRNLPAVFIDTFYDESSRVEKERFDENTDKLWKFAKSRNPFECKDIKIALTEIRELQVGHSLIHRKAQHNC